MISAPLSELCQVKHGGTPSKGIAAYWQGEIPWVSPKDMKASLLLDAGDHITCDAIANSATSLVPSGAILVVARSGILSHSLPVARAGRPLAFNQDIKALLPDSRKIDSDYLYWFVRSRESVVLKQGVKKGATVHSLVSGFLESQMVPLPPRNEQRRIVDLLSRAEGIVRLRREAQAKAQAIIPALFLDMFGDPATNPKGWPVAPLSDVAEIQGGLQVTSARAALPLERPYLRVANVYRAMLDLSEVKTIRLTEVEYSRTRLEPGDLLFVEGHGNPQEVGRVAVWNGSIPGCTHQNHLIRARPCTQALLPTFACYLLNSQGGRQALLRAGKTTSGLSTISAQNVKDADVMLPPIEQQTRFNERCSSVLGIVRQQTEALKKAEETFQALLARAFSDDLAPVPALEEAKCA